MILLISVFRLDDVSSKQEYIIKEEVHSSFITTTYWEQHPRSHHKGATGRVQTGNHDNVYPYHLQMYDCACIEAKWVVSKTTGSSCLAPLRVAPRTFAKSEVNTDDKDQRLLAKTQANGLVIPLMYGPFCILDLCICSEDR